MRHLATLSVLILAVACTTRSTSGTSTQGGSTVAGSTGSTSNSSSSSGGQGTSKATSGSGSGTTTGPIPSPYFDGGYVFCAQDVGDGGLRRWMCQPGTYFCSSQTAGACSQCRGDSDCADPSLPTYDPRRQRCDLDSGVPGYQGFCQQCTGDSECSLGGASHCDLDPGFPAGSLQPPIETLGFESCGPLGTDCRQLDGPLCQQFNETCDEVTGRCQPHGSCSSNQDCAGRFDVPYLPEPFCVGGACVSCDGGACLPNHQCFLDADCGNPDSLPTGLFCDGNSATCGCSDTSQCGAYWPICMGFDAGGISSGGTPLGFCGCDDTSQCGDGGFICIPATFDEGGFVLSVGAVSGGFNPIPILTRAGNFCGVPCNAPGTPACRTLSFFDISLNGPPRYDACDPASGLCEYCTVSETCQDSFGSGGPLCDTIFSGRTVGECLCLLNSDCPYGYLCLEGACVPSLARCSPSTCGENFCNWENGGCSSPTDPTIPRCLQDYDCPDSGRCEGGKCFGCVDNGDCRIHGPAESTLCCHHDQVCAAGGFLENQCAPFCHSDRDCVGNVRGPNCVVDGGTVSGSALFSCGCATDVDCTGNPNGAHCVTDPEWPEFGRCACDSDSQCPSGYACTFRPGAGPDNQDGGDPNGSCTNACGPFTTEKCPPGFFCGPDDVCRARCDEGLACAGPDLVCDLADEAGQNGTWGGFGAGADAGGDIWCYQCLDSRDCDRRLGCVGGACDACTDAGDCFAGTACAPDGLCHETCEQGFCDGGQVCDVYDRVGLGNVCFDCASPVDCPNGQGCDSVTHVCGTCQGLTDAGLPGDCPPDAICSTYWIGGTGVCLQNCDRDPCPPSAPICAVFPALTPDHSYCLGCREDDDCPDGGWCDQSIDRTFSCRDTPR